MTKTDLMIFDFDGTLVNSGDDFAASVNYLLKTLGVHALETEEIMQFIGNGTRILIEKSLGENFSDRFDEAIVLLIKKS